MWCFLLAANYFNNCNSYTTNKIVSQAKPSFDGGGGGGGAVGGVESLFVGKTAVVANWQTDLLSCLRA